MVYRKRFQACHKNAIFVLFLLLMLPFHSFGQIVFEKGYFIDNNNEKTECLIKNHEWKNSPTKIEYQLNDSTKAESADLKLIKEFGVSKYKYQRYTVNIDQSSDVLSDLSEDKNPIFVEETVFLRLIIEGSANLYEFGKSRRYFYNVNNSEVQQLIHKEYISENRVSTNNTFKFQLWDDLKCSCFTITEINDADYTKSDLIKFFEKYNTCVSSDFVNYDKNKKRVAFNLYIKPGLRWSTLSIINKQNSSQNIDFGGNLSFSLGIETELVLPFNRNKWSVFFEPTYQSYKAENPRPNYSNDVNYQSIELPLGIKYYIYFSNNSKIFVSAAIIFLDIPFNSSIGTLEINSVNNLTFGLGYILKNKFSLELRYGSRRRVLGNYLFYSSNYQSFSFILGYNFLGK